jgi:valyl-tRNA synthetase
VQDLVLRQTLLLLHPFIPFVTEELWQLLGYAADGKLIEDYPLAFAADLQAKVGRPFDQAAVAGVLKLQQFVSQARALKAEHNLASRRDVRFFVIADEAGWEALQPNLAKLVRLAGAAEIIRREAVEGAPAVVTPFGTLYLDLASTVDVGAEKQRLTKELEAINQHIAATEARLANPAFADKAPPAVIAGAQKQLAEQKAKRAELERLLAALKK